MNRPAYLSPFVLPVTPAARERHERVDVYPPGVTGQLPAVVFVHGGPIPANLEPTPRDWPVYLGYAAAAVARRAVAVTVDHRLHTSADYPQAARDVADAVETARQDSRVDPDRVAIWFFSGGGLLMSDWLREPPSWLRCVAATYPVLDELPDRTVDPRFRPTEAVAGAGSLPIVLTTVGLERADIAATIGPFVDAARAHDANLEVIDVPNGQHGFDHLDHTDESRKAVERALDRVFAELF
ncbi:prolyl oligopeptidase family serine peptidase [Solihabitans fulvus]|uniref:Prolyl oligopeptidase family serine peptidase n=1 Tax=Solihabitans fulvus TaxID=1892852 RepID=A0A5B2XB50_9PSEU|nr:prolyl oligopeptidase family serine peptidase [Solihabitans fulvus]KAA2260453.1 prolyl oligopeptidase family serine peptidase [Solihabitans fulvus]